MTGVKFLDDITVPRRSMVHPSQLRSRRSSTARDATRADPEAGMVEDFLAMSIYVPQLQVYGSAAKDLQAWIDNSKTHFAQANEDAQKLPPALFEEYLSIDEEGRADLVVSLVKRYDSPSAEGLTVLMKGRLKNYQDQLKGTD